MGFDAFIRSLDNAKDAKLLEQVMADRSALGRIGLMLGAATMMVMMIGAFVVGDHLTGRMQIEDGMRVVSLSSSMR